MCTSSSTSRSTEHKTCIGPYCVPCLAALHCTSYSYLYRHEHPTGSSIHRYYYLYVQMYNDKAALYGSACTHVRTCVRVFLCAYICVCVCVCARVRTMHKNMRVVCTSTYVHMYIPRTRFIVPRTVYVSVVHLYMRVR